LCAGVVQIENALDLTHTPHAPVALREPEDVRAIEGGRVGESVEAHDGRVHRPATREVERRASQ
jgi:hypothetical protein